MLITGKITPNSAWWDDNFNADVKNVFKLISTKFQINKASIMVNSRKKIGLSEILFLSLLAIIS